VNFDAFFSRSTPKPAGQPWLGGIAQVDETAYRSFPAISASMLKNATAAEMWHDMTEPRADHFGTEAEAEKWTVGILVHWCVLEPWRFDDSSAHLVLSPTKGIATKAAQAIRAEDSRLLVSPELMTTAIACRRAIDAHDEIRSLLSHQKAQRELSLFRFDEIAECWFKARIDYCPAQANYLLDVKTTAFPLPQFPREAIKRGYHIQAAWYLDLWHRLTGEWRNRWQFVVVTKSAPFMARTFHFDNWQLSHPLYDSKSPLKEARELIAKRVAIFTTAAAETREQLRRGNTLSEGQIRQLWPAYEFEESTPILL